MVFLPLVAISCGPATFTMNVEMRDKSKSGLDLAGKVMSVSWLEVPDSLFLSSVSEGFVQALEGDYYSEKGAMGVFRMERNEEGNYASKDTLVNLVLKTDADVAFLFDLSRDKELKLYVYDALNPRDTVYKFSGGDVSEYISGSADYMQELGKAYAGMFLSKWRGGKYSVVYFEMGEEAWRRGADAAYNYRWKEAMDEWMTLLDTGNMQKRGCAEYNIALACYMQGQYELAKEWLDLADKDYFISPSVELRKRLVP